MTFSGLPCLRDPKQSHKNSNSSASSSTSSSSSHSSSSPVSTTPETTTTSTERPIDPNTYCNDLSPVPSSSAGLGSGSGVLNQISSGEPLSAQMIEKSFEDLVQASMNNPSGTLIDMRFNNNNNNVNSSNTEVPLLENKMEYQQQQKPLSSVTNTGATKKKNSSQNIGPAHSASYRKRLNVNQVCDWCRYRKIRCDRESPCNSCQHSKRECIRTPASQLLKKNTEDEAEQSEGGSRSKRGRTEAKDELLSRGNKSIRVSNIDSHYGASYFSDQDQYGDDDSSSISSSMSPIAGSLTLAGLDLSGLTNLASVSSIGTTVGALDSLDSTSHDIGSQSMRSKLYHGANPLLESGQATLQDQEHLDRLRRIEVLLSNVVPGAAEFIATGSTGSNAKHSSELKKPLTVVTQGLDQSQREIAITPQEQLSKISLDSPIVNSVSSWSNNTPSPKNDESCTFDHQRQSPLSAIDYIERMKRIELLLSTVKNLPLATTIVSQEQSSKKPSMMELKKQNKNGTKKRRAFNNNGTAAKRPHVAAGFAGQKPPPKLPQAIAEAARKKKTSRKKRNVAGATRASDSDSTLAGSNTTKSTVEQNETETSSLTAVSYSTIENDRGVSINPHRGLVIPQEQDQQFYMSGYRDHAPFHTQNQYGEHSLNTYGRQSSVPDIGSLNMPFSEPITSYGSLVVPASSSTCSSATSSPRTSRAESISLNESVTHDALNVSSNTASNMEESMSQMMFSGSHAYFQDQHTSQVYQLPGSYQDHFGFPEQSLSPVDLTASRPLSQHAIHINQNSDFRDFGDLNTNESLEALMKKSVGNFGGVVGNLIGDSTTSMQSPIHKQGSMNRLGSSLYDTSLVAEQFPLFQQHQTSRQHRFLGLDIGKTGRTILMPNHSSSFAVPSSLQTTNAQQDRQQQQFQQQSSQSISISAADSPPSDIEMGLDLSSTEQNYINQQQQNAHAMLQQRQQVHQMAQLAQIRKNSFAGVPTQQRASIQHQSFYIPQMQDEDDDEGESIE
ncbi:hypothetical protein BGZ46_010350 [Entomortierella lignicola]|nr:hypothetical protein BGZ46_010350 [Entomortierella lignicola]